MKGNEMHYRTSQHYLKAKMLMKPEKYPNTTHKVGYRYQTTNNYEQKINQFSFKVRRALKLQHNKKKNL